MKSKGKRKALKAIIAAMAFTKKEKTTKKYWSKTWLSKRAELGIWKTLVKGLSREDIQSFKNFLRVDPHQFDCLLGLVKDQITKKWTNMRSPITPEERLALTLRYLATGESFRSLSFSFRIAHNTISDIIPEVCNAIYHALKDTYLKVPNTVEEWDKIATDFFERWNFPNCLGALDGKHVVVQAPFKSGSYYYNYKHTNSIVLMALVDANYRFIYVDVGSNGRVSDGGVFRECSLQGCIEENILNFPISKPLPGRERPVPHVIVADEAFPLKEYLMKPYPQKAGLSSNQRVFNYRLSRARRIVENTFGILANRFRVFRAPILLEPEKVEKVIMCCCALHNFLRPESSSANSADEGQVSGNGLIKLPNRGNNSSQAAKSVRQEFEEYFCTTGQVSWQMNK